jgi:hypothetical protein
MGTSTAMDERHRHARIARLRELAAEVERQAPSQARDMLLDELRSRAVAIETGDQESSMWRRWEPPRPRLSDREALEHRVKSTS